jgi:hypothetical protein
MVAKNEFAEELDRKGHRRSRIGIAGQCKLGQ